MSTLPVGCRSAVIVLTYMRVSAADTAAVAAGRPLLLQLLLLILLCFLHGLKTASASPPQWP